MASDSPIYMVTVSAPTNIAVIKYWGKADDHFNTPINDSVSMTLDQKDLRAVTTVAASKRFAVDRLWLNGEEEEKAHEAKRFRACVDGVKALATPLVDENGKVLVSVDDWKSMHVHVSSYNTFPTAAGLASSAAGYAALVATLAELMHAKEEFVGQLSTIARQGSGSACRSLMGGFVAWRKGNPPTWLDSMAVQIADEKHWPEMRALICVVSDQKKDTSSTSGMKTSVATSSLLKHRAETVVPQRMEAMEKAWVEKNFEGFGRLCMQDSNQFHATCLDTYPPIFYMNDISRSIIRLITVYNQWKGSICAAYTFDAGPNAVIYLLEEHVAEVGALLLYYFPSTYETIAEFVHDSSGTVVANMAAYKLDPSLLTACDKTGRQPTIGDVKKMYLTRAGPGPQVVPNESNLDQTTGLNTYKKP